MQVDGSTVFSQPWWLEAVAPGRWDIATVESNGEVRAIWPYATEKVAGGLLRVGAPPLTPYLGPVTQSRTKSKRYKQISDTYSLVDSLYEQLPRFDICKFNLRADQGPWFPLHRHGFGLHARQTYVLDFVDDLESMWADFHSATRGAIRKAEKLLVVEEATDEAALWEMVTGTFGRQEMQVPYDRKLLHRCVGEALDRQSGRVVVARDEQGDAHAASFVVWDDERAYYLVGGADPNRRESAGLSLLVWNAIRHASTRTMAFDFEGSMIPGIERFFSRFGGRPETYFEALGFSRSGRAAWAARNGGMRAIDELQALRSRFESRWSNTA